MTLEELLALLPDNTTGDIDAADLRTIVTELHTLASAPPAGDSNTVAQVFGYLWVAGDNTPAAGKAATNQPWGQLPTVLRLSETTDDGQNLVFTLVDSATDARVILAGAGGGILRADITGPSVDQGSYREIPISVTGTSGVEPINSEKMSVVVTVVLS
jgi:hypothetical protein